MKRLFLFCLISSLLAPAAQAQKNPNRFLEIGVLLGLTNYSGDIAESSIEFATTKPGFGIYGRYHLNRLFGVKTHVYFGSIKGDDKYSDNRKNRFFRFESSLTEVGAVFEWKPLGKERVSGTGLYTKNFTPYLFAGVGVAFANAEAEYYGPEDRRNDVLRIPLPEEGLKTTFITTPVGVGLRADFFDRFILGGEFGWRPVYSDHLDGIAINGNPDRNDWYYFFGLTLSMVLSSTNDNTLD